MRFSSLVSALLYPSSPIPQECAHGTFISNVNYLRKKFETTTSMTTRNWQRQFCIYHGDTEQQDSVFHQCKPREPMETLYNKIVLSTNASHSKVIAQRSDEPRKTPKNKMVFPFWLVTRATTMGDFWRLRRTRWWSPRLELHLRMFWRHKQLDDANGGRSKCKRMCESATTFIPAEAAWWNQNGKGTSTTFGTCTFECFDCNTVSQVARRQKIDLLWFTNPKRHEDIDANTTASSRRLQYCHHYYFYFTLQGRSFQRKNRRLL